MCNNNGLLYFFLYDCILLGDSLVVSSVNNHGVGGQVGMSTYLPVLYMSSGQVCELPAHCQDTQQVAF